MSGKSMRLFLFLFLFLQSCTTIELTLAQDRKGEIKGGNPFAILRMEREVTDRLGCGYTHISHLFTGKPFNDNQEDTADMIGCTIKVK